MIITDIKELNVVIDCQVACNGRYLHAHWRWHCSSYTQVVRRQNYLESEPGSICG